jgi:hypothetical protein
LQRLATRSAAVCLVIASPERAIQAGQTAVLQLEGKALRDAALARTLEPRKRGSPDLAFQFVVENVVALVCISSVALLSVGKRGTTDRSRAQGERAACPPIPLPGSQAAGRRTTRPASMSTTVTGPRMRTWRRRLSQWKSRAARGLASSSRLLGLFIRIMLRNGLAIAVAF